ncbi:MAG: phage tail tube protein [Firmicutes bacterium]|nr:phage tail tube protein [Bacillota bacterium]
MYTGLTGKIKIDGEVAYISNWSVDTSREIIEVAELGKPYKKKVAGSASWSASADGTVVFGSGADSHSKLFVAMNSGEPVECEFILNENASVKFTGKALIESLSVDLSAEDKGNISIALSGIDALTHPTA